MGVGGLRHAEQVLQVNLACARVEQVGTAHDMGDAGGGVIDDDGKLLGKQAVRPQHDKDADVAREALQLRA